MEEPGVELDSVTLRAGGVAPHALGCGLLFLAGALAFGVAWPWKLASDGLYLQAAVIALMAFMVVTAALEQGLSRAARGFSGWVRECLGARRLLVLVERRGRPGLSLELRRGSRRFVLREVPLDLVLSASATTLQGGSPALHVACVEDALFEPCPASEAGTLAATIERWRAEAARARAPGLPRCAICHAPDAEELLATCPACSTRFHATCELELGGRCPTLGCARPVVDGTTLEAGVLEVPLSPRPRQERVFALAWIALGAIAAALLVRSFLGLAPLYELVQGAALGSITLLPFAALLLTERLGLVEDLLSILGGPGRRTLALDATTTPPVLVVGWRFGPLRLPVARLVLGEKVRLEVAPAALVPGYRVMLCGVQLADGVGLAHARRIEAHLRGALPPGDAPGVVRSKDDRTKTT